MKCIFFAVVILCVTACSQNNSGGSMTLAGSGPQYRDAEDYYRQYMTDHMKEAGELDRMPAKIWKDFLDCSWSAIEDRLSAADMAEFDKVATGHQIPATAGNRIKRAFMMVFDVTKPRDKQFDVLKSYCPKEVETFEQY